MKNLILYSVLLLITSCGDDNNKGFVTNIDNQSSFVINDMKLYPYAGGDKVSFVDSIVFSALDANTASSQQVELGLPPSDGSFLLRLTLDNEDVEKTFGYFSNGSVLKDEYNITITSDAVIVE